MAAVREYGLALKYASPELRADKEVVMEAVRQNGLALQYASPELKADKEAYKGKNLLCSGETDLLTA